MTNLANIKPRQIIKVLKSIGFKKRRQTGSHLIFKHPKTKKMAIVPIHPKDLKTNLVRAIIKQSGLSKKEFLDKLK